jgi:hypothetical protein
MFKCKVLFRSHQDSEWQRSFIHVLYTTILVKNIIIKIVRILGSSPSDKLTKSEVDVEM